MTALRFPFRLAHPSTPKVTVWLHPSSAAERHADLAQELLGTGCGRVRKVAPHQLGQMTYARATSVGVSVRLGARGRKSWPRILSPEGRGGSPACRLYSERAARAPSPLGEKVPEGRMRGP